MNVPTSSKCFVHSADVMLVIEDGIPPALAQQLTAAAGVTGVDWGTISIIRMLGSPELHALPILPHPTIMSTYAGIAASLTARLATPSPGGVVAGADRDDDDDDDDDPVPEDDEPED